MGRIAINHALSPIGFLVVTTQVVANQLCDRLLAENISFACVPTVHDSFEFAVHLDDYSRATVLRAQVTGRFMPKEPV
jgi:hypothetical protein